MAVALSSFYTEIKLQIPNAPTPLLDTALRAAAYTFCNRSSIVQEPLQANAVAGNPLVSFTNPADLVVRRPIKVWYGENEIFSAGPSLVNVPSAYFTPVAGTSLRFIDMRGEQMRVFPAPQTSQANVFTMLAVLVPTDAATTLPDVLFREWRLAIAAGARAYIRAMPAQPWSADATRDNNVFNAAVNDAMASAAMGSAGGEVKVTAAGPFGLFGRR